MMLKEGNKHMEKLSRRVFTQSLFGSLFTFSLVNTLAKSEMLSGHIKPVVNQWVTKMEEVTKALRLGKVKPVEWQLEIESLLARVELSDLLRAIDYQHLAKTAVFPDDHESAEDIDFSKIEDLPSELSFAP